MWQPGTLALLLPLLPPVSGTLTRENGQGRKEGKSPFAADGRKEGEKEGKSPGLKAVKAAAPAPWLVPEFAADWDVANDEEGKVSLPPSPLSRAR